MTEELEARLMEAEKHYVESLDSIQAVAKATGISRGTIQAHSRREHWCEKRRRYREEQGLPQDVHAYRGHKGYDVVSAEMAYITTGATLAQLSEAMGVTYRSLRMQCTYGSWRELRAKYRAAVREGLRRRAAGEAGPDPGSFKIPDAVISCIKDVDLMKDRKTAEMCVRYITGNMTLKQLAAETGESYKKVSNRCALGRWSALRDLYQSALIEPLTKAAVAAAVNRIARAGEVNAQLLEQVARRIPDIRELRDCLNGFLCVERCITNEMLVSGKMTPYDTARIELMKEQLEQRNKALQLKQQSANEKQVVEVVWPDAQVRAWGE